MFFVIIVLSIVLGVVLEYHFSLYARARLLWPRRIIAGVVVLATCVATALMIAGVMAVLLGTLLALKVSDVPEDLSQILPIIGGIIVTLGTLFWELLSGLFSWLGLALRSLILAATTLIVAIAPSCQPGGDVAPVAPTVLETVPAREEVALVVAVHPGDGCIRITRRGGHELNLSECVTLTEGAGRRVFRGRRGIEAPRVYPGDTFVYREKKWVYRRRPA